METIEIDVTTGARPEVADLTEAAARFVRGRGDGLLSVFVPHATAGVAVVEVGAGSERDLLAAIDELLPATDGRWAHRHGSPGHGRDHVLPAFIGASVTVPVIGGVAGPRAPGSPSSSSTRTSTTRQRRVRLSFLPG
jgi:thiamine phosphate synthase YjbQ (UPF0047 family)